MYYLGLFQNFLNILVCFRLILPLQSHCSFVCFINHDNELNSHHCIEWARKGVLDSHSPPVLWPSQVNPAVNFECFLTYNNLQRHCKTKAKCLPHIIYIFSLTPIFVTFCGILNNDRNEIFSLFFCA